MSSTVTCCCSGKKFEPLFVTPGKAPTQAYGCACEVAEGHLVGHFGSVYDMTVFTFLRDPLPDGHVVCDDCVTAMIENGRIREV